MVENVARKTSVELRLEEGEVIIMVDLDEEARFLQLYELIRYDYPIHENDKISLYNVTKEDVEVVGIKESEETYDLPLFDETCIKEENGISTLYLIFEIYFVPRTKLKVYFYSANNKENLKFCEVIKTHLSRFVDLYKFDYLDKYDFEFEDKEIWRNKAIENELVIVICSGRFVANIFKEDFANKILVFTGKDNLESLQKTYESNTEKVAFIGIRIEDLLQDKFFLTDELLDI